MAPGQRRPRSSYAAPSSRGSFPATVTNHASSIFPYSTARPPTNYSQQSWVQPVAGGVRHPAGRPADPFSDHDEEDVVDERETPLYARSDWGGSDVEGSAANHSASGRRSLLPSASTRSSRRRDATRRGDTDEEEYDADEKWREKSTAWTQSSWAGPRTDDLRTVHEGTEEDELAYTGTPHRVAYDGPALTGARIEGGKRRSKPLADTSNKRQTVFGGTLMASPGMMSDIGTARDPTPAISGRHSLHYTAGPGASQYGEYDRRPRSELPSVFSLGQLQYTAAKMEEADPFHDGHATGPIGMQQRQRYSAAPTPGLDPPNAFAEDGRTVAPEIGILDAQDAALMTPEAQQRLGRMSVAPARYSVSGDSQGPSSGQDHRKPDHMHQVDDQSFWAKPFGKGLLTYRPHLNALASTLAACLLTVCLTGYKGFGGLIEIKSGGFGYMRSKSGAGASLGISGWCEIDAEGEACQAYTPGDFSNPATAFAVPGDDTVMSTLLYAMSALTAIIWLLATFNLATLALRSILFFGLSLPQSHLTDAVYPTRKGRERTKKIPGEMLSQRSYDAEEGADGPLFGIEEVQAEVDMRVRCERPPFESWEWVWWAWWAHRRGPVGRIFASFAGLMSLVTLGLAVGFKMQVSDAAEKNSVSFGAGVFLPLVAVILLADHIHDSTKYWIHAQENVQTFLQPPEPTPAAILLPSSLRPMRKLVHSTGSFFAPRTTLPPGAELDPDALPFADTAAGNLADLDPETIRWLAAYPSDPELVPLIARLRGGEDHTDFVLSETGLLYLKPDPDAAGNDPGSQNALLIPPAGSIRQELLDDAHLEILEGEDSGVSAHWGPGTMLAILSETFWWVEMEEDIHALVTGCPVCSQEGPRTATGGEKEVLVQERKVRMSQLAPGMTPLPFTGVTGWTGLGTSTANPLGKEGAQTGLVTIGESAMAAEIAFATRKAEEDARDVEVLR